MMQYAQLLAYVQRFYEPGEQRALLDMLTLEPADAEAARRLAELGCQVVYETDRTDFLLAHAPRPVSIETAAALNSP
jgi:cytosine deaminase